MVYYVIKYSVQVHRWCFWGYQWDCSKWVLGSNLISKSQWPSDINWNETQWWRIYSLELSIDGKFSSSLFQVTFLKTMTYERRPSNNISNMSSCHILCKWPSEILLISNLTRLSKKSACNAKNFRNLVL